MGNLKSPILRNFIFTGISRQMRKGNMYRWVKFGNILFLCAATIFLVAGCDSSGSSSDSNDIPDWRGDWEVLSVDGESIENPDFRMFYSIGENEIEEIDSFSEGSCSVKTWSITNKDGDELDIESEERGEERKIRLDTSGDTLIWTVVESEGDDVPYDNTATSIDSDPRDILQCN